MLVHQHTSNKNLKQLYEQGYHITNQANDQYNSALMANGRFMITKSIGKGSFGEIFQGIDTQSNQEVAIKMEHKHCKVKVLAGEAKILKQLQGLEGFPKLYWFGQEHNQNILVMELLGPSLSTLFKNNGSKFSLQTVLKLTDQIVYCISHLFFKLHRIELMHNAGYIHRDIKPSNFVMGVPGTKNQNNLYIIDFGLSKPYKDIKRGIHFPQLPPGPLSRRDDLESIAYMVIQFLRGNLPWQGAAGANKLEKYQNILEIKMLTIDEILCKELPEQFCRFLKYVKDLEYDEKPDYKRLRLEFKVLLMDTFNQNDSFQYDWQLKKQKSQTTKKPMITVAPLQADEQILQKIKEDEKQKHLNQTYQDQLKLPNNHQNMNEQPEESSVKQSKLQESEEDVKIPLLFHNYEGFPIQEEVQSINIINQDMVLDTENDSFYIQKQVAEDTHAHHAFSLQANISSFAFYPNQKAKSRVFHLTLKQEQARLNRLKQLYGQYKGLCPNFLFSKEKKDSNSLCSMEPIMIEKDNQGHVQILEQVSKNPSSIEHRVLK
ncbi:serine threonine protein kinase [Stylonychia lemnae]|uniref:Casein kinase I n=1 Tax=Stylonychia lemnae TaxID=5949 RepID=A0A078AUK5_STYLE|nr:serine threonine protein kinase [Stylonychia lemnae]|eukprot:CDW86085.1 serine threonine protein kinase [Stylonychia lemnae]